MIAKSESRLKALRVERDAAKRLMASAKSSAAVAGRLVDEGSDLEVCSLAKVTCAVGKERGRDSEAVLTSEWGFFQRSNSASVF